MSSFLATMAISAVAAISGPGVSHDQLQHALTATRQATQRECKREETYLRVGEIPMKVGHCESVHVGTAFQDLIARTKYHQRRILVLGSFVIHDRFGPTDGRKFERRKLYSWAVLPPIFGWFLAHQDPVTPWVGQPIAN